MGEIVNTPLSAIRLDGGTQPRAALDPGVVEDYAALMREGVSFPPPIVFQEGATCWLADGFHRYHAAVAASLDALPCDVRPGTRRDAVLFSVGANATHGLRRTNADKRKSVETLLADEEWCAWSDREIARRCGVSNDFVSRLRPAICHSMTDEPTSRTVERNGTVFTMNTASIGRSQPEPQVADAPIAPLTQAPVEFCPPIALIPSPEQTPEIQYESQEEEESAEELLRREDERRLSMDTFSEPTVTPPAPKEDPAARAQQAEKLRDLVEKAGPVVPIPPAPDLRWQTAVSNNPKYAAEEDSHTRTAFDRQVDVLDRLLAVKARMQALAKEEPFKEGEELAAALGAIRSSLSQIVAAAYAMGTAYNLALDAHAPLRIVKQESSNAQPLSLGRAY